MRTNKGFTLAEVLITLGIIGVVAALTLPQVITNYEKKATEVRLRKDFATFANALKMAEAEYGPLETWDTDNPNTAYHEYFKRLSKYLQLATEPCYESGNCFPKNPGSYYSYSIYFRLKDGTYGMYTDNGLSNGGHRTSNPKHFVYFITNENKAINGRTIFQLSILNFKNIKINSASSGSNIYYWSYTPSCPNGSYSWNSYDCAIKFVMDGFKFKDNYNYGKLNGTDSTIANILKTKPRGWQ